MPHTLHYTQRDAMSAASYKYPGRIGAPLQPVGDVLDLIRDTVLLILLSRQHTPDGGAIAM